MLNWRGIRGVKNLVVDRMLEREGILNRDRRCYQEIIKTVDARAYRRRLRLVREIDLRSRLPEISVRTIVFASGRDRIVPSVSAATLMAARIPDAELHVFPQAGHALLLTPGFSLADYV
jgi:pimeloyl-ACP methyl ester carboxylesterase